MNSPPPTGERCIRAMPEGLAFRRADPAAGRTRTAIT